jgi:hypothetical protein
MTEQAPEYVEDMFNRLTMGGAPADRPSRDGSPPVPENLSRVVLVAERPE